MQNKYRKLSNKRPSLESAAQKSDIFKVNAPRQYAPPLPPRKKNKQKFAMKL